jgi:MarR family transcriptional regulator, lower aerobic nicotinate degradation pathway regulator
MKMQVPDVERRSPGIPGELMASTLFLLARLGLSVKARVLEEFEQRGFSVYQYSVLAILNEGSSDRQSSIADALGFDRGQLVGILDDLEDRGLVERRRDESDRRRHSVSLTPDGRRQLVKLRKVIMTIEDSVLEPLDERARKSLHGALLTVAAHSDPRFAGLT